MALFGAEYQAGSFFEVFSAQGSQPLSNWKTAGGGTVQRVYDKTVKGYVYHCTNGRMQVPKDDRKSMSLLQPITMMQLYLGSGGRPFSIEVGFTDIAGTRRRIILSSSFHEVKVTTLHAQLPIAALPRGVWMNLALDMASLVPELFGVEFRATCLLLLGPYCRLRRVFTLKELYGVDDEVYNIPRPLDFLSSVQHVAHVFRVQPPSPTGVLEIGGVVPGDSTKSKSSSHRSGDGVAAETSHQRKGSVSKDAPHLAFGSRFSKLSVSESQQDKDEESPIELSGTKLVTSTTADSMRSARASTQKRRMRTSKQSVGRSDERNAAVEVRGGRPRSSNMRTYPGHKPKKENGKREKNVVAIKREKKKVTVKQQQQQQQQKKPAPAPSSEEMNENENVGPRAGASAPSNLMGSLPRQPYRTEVVDSSRRPFTGQERVTLSLATVSSPRGLYDHMRYGGHASTGGGEGGGQVVEQLSSSSDEMSQGKTESMVVVEEEEEEVVSSSISNIHDDAAAVARTEPFSFSSFPRPLSASSDICARSTGTATPEVPEEDIMWAHRVRGVDGVEKDEENSCNYSLRGETCDDDEDHSHGEKRCSGVPETPPTGRGEEYAETVLSESITSRVLSADESPNEASIKTDIMRSPMAVSEPDGGYPSVSVDKEESEHPTVPPGTPPFSGNGGRRSSRSRESPIHNNTKFSSSAFTVDYEGIQESVARLSRAYTPPMMTLEESFRARGGGGGGTVKKEYGGQKKRGGRVANANFPRIADDGDLDLMYDPILNCYYDPKTNCYYELKN